MPWVYEVIISTTCRNVSKTYNVYVTFSDVASAVNVLTISILLYSDIQISIQQYTSYKMGLLKQTWRFNTFFKHEKVKRALEYVTDAIITFGLIMLYLQHIILKLFCLIRNN